MKREILIANFLGTICWTNDLLVDWASAGKLFSSDGPERQLGKFHYGSGFDGSIISSNGQYAFIYKRLETKGLLLKRGELLREINRSYYCAGNYEYPAAFVTINSITYLIHCPSKYNRLDFENVETGEIITNIPQRVPSDVFHSRLEVSADSRFLMSKGWYWHPRDTVEVFDIAACMANPLLLDNSDLTPGFAMEICTGSFINNSQVLIGSSDEVFDDDDVTIIIPPKNIAIWNLLTNEITDVVKVNGEFGNLFAINDELAWDTFNFPKIINIRTGEITDSVESIDSGRQNSSIIGSNTPQIAFNRQTKQLAIGANKKIEILTPTVGE